jgi:pimeloyl-ACP methyl ester carboxylesterase
MLADPLMPQASTPAVTSFANRTGVVDGVKLHYLAAGSGPAIVLLHGYAETSRMWRPLIPTLAQRFSAKKIKLVAEKVETIEVSDATREAGYDYFQGFYFCRPRTFAATHLPARRLAYIQLLAALNRPDLSFDELENLVKHDLSLSYRVMRSANSAAYAIHREVTSIRSALVLLGFDQIRKWASVWAIAGLSGGDAPAAVSLALVRARGLARRPIVSLRSAPPLPQRRPQSRRPLHARIDSPGAQRPALGHQHSWYGSGADHGCLGFHVLCHCQTLMHCFFSQLAAICGDQDVFEHRRSPDVTDTA